MAKALATTKLLGSRFIVLRRFLMFFVFFLLFIVIFSNAIVKSIEAGSITPLINDLGGRFFLSTQQIETSSQEILDQGGVFDFNEGVFKGLWKAISTYSDLIFSLFVVYYWIKVLAFLTGHSFLSDTSRKFANYSFALLFFFGSQFLFIAIGIAQGSVSTENGLFFALATPFRAFYTFFRMIPLLLSPISKIADKFIGGDPGNLTDNFTG